MSQEVFDYSSLLFASLLSCNLLVASLEQEKKYWLWILWGVSCVIGFYTHFFMALVVGSQLITFLFWRGKSRREWMGIATATIVAILLYLPFLFRATSMMQRMYGEIQIWGAQPSLGDILKKAVGVFYYQIAGYYYSDLDWNSLRQIAASLPNLLLFLALFIFPLIIFVWGFCGWKKLERKIKIVLVPMFLVPFLMVFASGISARQLIVLSPAIFVLLGYGLMRIKAAWQRLHRILPIILVLGLAASWGWSLVQYYRLEVNPVRQENWRDVFKIIEKDEKEGDVIYNHSSLTGEIAQRIYYHGNLPRVHSSIDADAIQVSDTIAGTRGILVHIDFWIEGLLERYDRVWFIYATSRAPDFDAMIVHAEQEHSHSEWLISRDLRLILFEK